MKKIKLKTISRTNVIKYILDSQEIMNILKNNPDVDVYEVAMMDIQREYFGVVKIDSTYYVLAKREKIYTGPSLGKAVYKLSAEITRYIHFRNPPPQEDWFGV